MFPAEINKFISSIKQYGDLSRSDRFLVQIPLPNFIFPINELNDGSELLTLRCEDAELPGKALSTFEIRTHGPIQKFPNLMTYNDITLTFLCSANPNIRADITLEESGFVEKMIFENWMDYINPKPNITTNSVDIPYYNFTYKRRYQRDITIQHYDLYDKLNYEVKLIDAFPVAMNQISLAWNNDQVARISVTFSYTRWQRETTPARTIANWAQSGLGGNPTQVVTTQIPDIRPMRGPPGAPQGTPQTGFTIDPGQNAPPGTQFTIPVSP